VAIVRLINKERAMKQKAATPVRRKATFGDLATDKAAKARPARLAADITAREAEAAKRRADGAKVKFKSAKKAWKQARKAAKRAAKRAKQAREQFTALAKKSKPAKKKTAAKRANRNVKQIAKPPAKRKIVKRRKATPVTSALPAPLPETLATPASATSSSDSSNA
jgi:hypothetical protein